MKNKIAFAWASAVLRSTKEVLEMFIANKVVPLIAFPMNMVEGPTPVKDAFTSNCLNEFTRVKNRVTVKAGRTIGIVMALNRCHGVAPSICAASIKSRGTF